jgi:hypothetical protein
MPETALLRLIGRRHADAEPLAQGSGGQREFVERDRHPLVHWLLACEVVVPTPQVLHEAMPNEALLHLAVSAFDGLHWDICAQADADVLPA